MQMININKLTEDIDINKHLLRMKQNNWWIYAYYPYYINLSMVLCIIKIRLTTHWKDISVSQNEY